MLKQFKRNNLILIVIALILILGNSVFLWTKYQASLEPTFSENAMKAHPLFQAKIKKVTDEVLAQSMTLPDGSFNLGAGIEAEELFEEFFNTIKSADLFRIKVWDRNYTVLWANATEAIGKSYPDNHEAQEALEGEMEVEVKKGEVSATSKSESFTERSFSNYAEVYVPIKDKSGKIVGIIETYVVTEDVVGQLRSEFYKSVITSVAVSGGIFALAYLALRFL